MNESIIQNFCSVEAQKNKYSTKYLMAIEECTTLEDLVTEVSMYILETHGERSKAALYILEALDTFVI